MEISNNTLLPDINESFTLEQVYLSLHTPSLVGVVATAAVAVVRYIAVKR
jgi:hypothetical protein